MNNPKNASNTDLFSKFNKLEGVLIQKMEEWETATEELEQLENKRKLLLS
jgi:predicted patatin/cPLA2 family phospholipase